MGLQKLLSRNARNRAKKVDKQRLEDFQERVKGFLEEERHIMAKYLVRRIPYAQWRRRGAMLGMEVEDVKGTEFGNKLLQESSGIITPKKPGIILPTKRS